MPHQILSSSNTTGSRFAVAGIVNTCFGFVSYPALHFALAPLAVHYLVVLALAHGVAVTFAYLTHKVFVFRTRGDYLREYSLFSFFHVWMFLGNMVALRFAVESAGFPAVYAQLVITAALAFASYLWHLNVTFRKKS